jgi:hypothetical protein
MSGHKGPQIEIHHPKGTVCEIPGCTTIVSIYNDATICGVCFRTIPLEDLSYKFFAKFR